MIADVNVRGSRLDRVTQAWVRWTGRQVALSESPWLHGPVGDTDVIGDRWLSREAERLGGTVSEGGGLLTDMSGLAGEDFDPSLLADDIVDFYECTDRWRLEVWSQWSPLAWPFGWLLSAVFARRLQQLSLPLRPLDAAQGLDSRVLTVRDGRGLQLGAAWLRTLRSTRQTVYSGWYGTAQLPGTRRPSVCVAFPLPNGRVTVFLRPDNGPNGSLVLTSPAGDFGEDGAYLIVAGADGEHAWARRVRLLERFVVWVDAEGTARADHSLDFGHLAAIRLHYRLERRPET